MIALRRVRWTGHTASKNEIGNGHKILVGKLKGRDKVRKRGTTGKISM
jgi:hypothetical protein